MTACNRIPFDIKEATHYHLTILVEINLMDILDLIYRYDHWGMRQNHAGRRNSDKLDDYNLLLISVGHEAESCRP